MSNALLRLVIVLRHMAYERIPDSDAQPATEAGELECFAMGQHLRRDHGVTHFSKIWASEMPRTQVCGVRLQDVISLRSQPHPLADLHTSPSLRDWGTDERFNDLMKREMRRIMMVSGVTPEQAIFSCPSAQDLIETKAGEAMSLIDRIRAEMDDGNVLVVMHGGTIDKLYEQFAQITGNSAGKSGMGVFGRQIGTCEGFVLTYENSEKQLVDLHRLVQPIWTRVAVAATK